MPLGQVEEGSLRCRQAQPGILRSNRRPQGMILLVPALKPSLVGMDLLMTRAA